VSTPSSNLPTEYEIRVHALTLALSTATNQGASVHEAIKRAKEFAAYLRDALDIDRAERNAATSNETVTDRRCDSCLRGMHPHTFMQCPNSGCQCDGI
jgi:hypothetical protein